VWYGRWCVEKKQGSGKKMERGQVGSHFHVSECVMISVVSFRFGTRGFVSMVWV
jgi:hypothetical protein